MNRWQFLLFAIISLVLIGTIKSVQTKGVSTATVVPAKNESDVMFCLQSYQGLRIDRSLVY